MTEADAIAHLAQAMKHASSRLSESHAAGATVVLCADFVRDLSKTLNDTAEFLDKIAMSLEG